MLVVLSGARCLVVDKAAQCMAIIMTVIFISIAGTCVTSVREESPKYTGFFLCTCYWIIYLLLTHPKREKKGQSETVDLSLVP